MSEENVKVAVRVRPFNKRELARNAKLIVEMSGPTTRLVDPENPNEKPKQFSFDFSYWSHDGCKEKADGYMAPDPSHPNGKKYCDQINVFNNLGQGILNNAWDGYNSTLFAYGQTGSGKSWSVVGYDVNRGIVPQYCDEMFKGVDKRKAENPASEFEVSFSMLEIYMEEVRDLFDSGPKKKGGLRVRQHPKKGFYAEGLKVAPVGSYAEIEQKMEEGTRNRTVACTNMNATSSRAHTMVGITLVQKFKNAAGEDTTKSAVVNLVDLAGSERAESTGATGDRLKEGAAINQSLSSLGNCIAALAEQSEGKQTKVPYRDSTLTKLLKNALSGNSKTIMIAAISPADINYEETLSTLRYADRAKQIKTKAVVNEDPTEKLIRELQEENEKLKAMMASGGLVLQAAGDGEQDDTEGMTAAEKEAYRKELEEDYRAQLDGSAHEMEEMRKDFEQKLAEARAAGGGAAISDTMARRGKEPHIYNLNMDPQLSNKVVHFLTGDKVTIGSPKGEASDITLVGPSILENHAVIAKEGKGYTIDKLNAAARILVNGQPITEKTEVHHHDRLMVGTIQLYVLCLPAEGAKQSGPAPTFESAQEEIAANSGFDMQTENKSRDDLLLQEDLIDMLPAVEEANSISQDLDRKRKFEVMLVSPDARGELKGRTKIYVRMTDLETDQEWVWSREKFLNRKFIMQELFQKWQEGDDISKVPDAQDPFTEDPDAEVHLGSVKVWLQSLAYNIEIREQLEITDFKGTEMGLLNVELVPCNKKGKEYGEKDDAWVDSPQELVGKDLHFISKVVSARGLPSKFTDIYAKYLVYLDDDYTATKPIKDTTNPDWKHSKQFSFTPATDQLVKYMETEAVMIQIWGKHKVAKKKTINTKQLLQKQQGGVHAANSNVKRVDADKVRIMMQLAVSQKRAEKAEKKVGQFRELVRLAEELSKPRISTRLIKDLLHAPSKDEAEKCFKLVAKETSAEGNAGAQKVQKQQQEEKPKHAPSKSKPQSASDDVDKKSSTCVLL